MQWHYALNSDRKGPVSDSDLFMLAQQGVILDSTLVWREGMAEWQPYSTIKASLPPPDAAGAEDETSAICVVSGKRYPKREMLQYEGHWISAEHRDEYFQRLREGVAPTGSSVVPGPYGYGGFWIRFLAVMVDAIIVGVVNFFLGYLIGLGAGVVGTLAVTVIAQFAGLALAIAYEIYFIRKSDATPGKMALGLKLLRTDGQKLSKGRIIGRYFGKLLSSLILAIGYIMAGMDDEKRALHDRICDTRVIKTR